MQEQPSVRLVEPVAVDWRRFAYANSSFDTARRSMTPVVEGTIRLPQTLLLATLEGAAERLEIDAACGHRYRGPERTGMISIVPANCERRLRLYEVSSRWASLAIDNRLVQRVFESYDTCVPQTLYAHCVSNVEDVFLHAALSELTRTYLEEGCLDLTYFDTLTAAIAHHLVKRYLVQRSSVARPQRLTLPAWKMRRVAEYVDAHVEQTIRVADLAALTGFSEGYFHRAFRRTLGMTPLDFINQRRIERALHIWKHEPRASVLDIAVRVGYTSPSYFARMFRKITGQSPVNYLRRKAALFQFPAE